MISRRIIGWSIEENMLVESVLKALRMALQKLVIFPATMLLHSDRGSQYAAAIFRQSCSIAGIVQSMSSKGNCWDNALAESVNGKLKTELIYRHKVFQTKEEARNAIIEYIEGYYNCKRRHQTLNYRRPNEVWNEYFDDKLTKMTN